MRPVHLRLARRTDRGNAYHQHVLSTVRVRVPAKINLALSVGPPRSDGFHNLATVFQAVSLFDEVAVRRTRQGDAGDHGDGGEPTAKRALSVVPRDLGSTPRVSISGLGESTVPTDERNLAWQAVAALADRLGREPDVTVSIKKTIPVAGGMAGGSADAAAALLAAARLWGDAPTELLAEVAGELGSDVPFALLGGTAVGVGRGELLTPALVRGSYQWVFALSDGGLSTPDVYRRCDELRGVDYDQEPRLEQDVMLALRSGDPEALGRGISNDLQPAAISLMPHLQDVLELGVEHGALGGIVSGSGPTCGFLVGDVDAAVDLGVALSSSGLCSAVRRAEGPVPGAMVISAD